MTLTVYYLDDESALCSIFRDIFTTSEISIETFTTAAEAIDACRTNPPDVMFIDLTLAETTGDKVAEVLDDTIFKVLITGDLSYQSHKLFDACLTKPYDLPAIQQLLAGRLDKVS